MTTILSEGVKVPDVGSVNWAGDLEVNWNLLNGALANLSGNVKLDRDNTWTGEQSFTLPIVGSITGTASKAIADEDGTSIKTGYVNVAGNQTVSGQKTWSGYQFFTSAVYHKSTTYEIGNIPTSNIVTNIFFADKNSVYTGFARNVIYSSGRTATEIRAKNAFKSGVLDPTGSDISSNLNVEVQPDGTKSLYFDGSIRNNVLPYTTNTYSLGSSSYQWSSVYAQTYYYNGTAWGLDKANNWTGTNSYTGIVSLNSSSDVAEQFKQKLPKDVSTSNDAMARVNSLVDSAGHYVVIETLGHWANYVSKNIFLKYKNDSAKQGAIEFRLYSDGTGIFYPQTPFQCDLGNSYNKWKTLNGVNPGALSLPSLNYSQWIDLSGNLTEGEYWYYPIVDGWVFVIANNNPVALNVLVLGAGGSGKLIAGATGVLEAGVGAMWVSSPAPAGSRVRVRLNKGSTGALEAAWFIPCAGNV